MRSVLCWTGAVLLAVGCLVSSLPAAPTAEQQTKATAANDAINQARTLILAKKFSDALPFVVQAQTALAELNASNAEGKKLAAGLQTRLDAARRILKDNGVAVPDPVAPGASGTAPAAGGVSFTKEIAPIMVARCNNCHVTGTRGGFSMANYNALMKGSMAGVVVFPGKSDGSRLMEVLDSGDMPRGGGKLPDAQLSLIAKWIDEGAKFDGTDPNATLSGSATPMNMPKLQVVQATGKESVLFSRDIAPVLSSQCLECHSGGRPAARLGLDTFENILAGDRDGPVITPGKPAESLLIKKIKGEAGARMPLRKSPLSADTIAKFEKWIAEGAKFDGTNSKESVDMIARVYIASHMSHEDLAKERSALAMKNWALANPDDKPDLVENNSFILLGNTGESVLTEIRDLAESQQPKVARILKAPTDAPLVKGRITFYVFKQRYDYSELGRMLEKRDIPNNWYGHWKYNVVDAYAALLPPSAGEYSLSALVSEQLAGNYLDSLGPMPGWFTQGSAWAVGSMIDVKDPRHKQWDESTPRLLGQSKKADDFLTGQLPPADTAVLNYSFCKFLMANTKAYQALLTDVSNKKSFDQAFQNAYRGTPTQLISAWGQKIASGR